MKKFLTLALAALSLISASASAMADESRNYGTIVCVQNRDYSPVKDIKTSVVMRQIGTTRFYQLEVYQKNVTVSPSANRLVLVDRVHVTTEDVNAVFRGTVNKKVSVQIFLDELNQSSLSAPGLKINLTCRLQG